MTTDTCLHPGCQAHTCFELRHVEHARGIRNELYWGGACSIEHAREILSALRVLPGWTWRTIEIVR